MRVAETAAPPACGQPALAAACKVVEQLARRRVKDLCADRDTHHCVFAISARTIRALAVASALGDVFRVIAQVKQRVQRLVGFEPEVAAAPAVPARWPTARHEFLAAKGRHAVAAVSALDANLGAINKQLKFKIESDAYCSKE